MESYGKVFRDFFRASESKVFQELANRIVIGPKTADGLQEAIDKKQSHVAGRRIIQQTIAKLFTDAEGRTKLYLGRQSIFPAPSAWPIPHDAPYKSALDRIMMAVIEAGLYEKWSADTIDKVKEETKLRLKELALKASNASQTQKFQEEEEQTEETQKTNKALTIVHAKGPLLLLVFGLLQSAIIFVGEMVVYAIFGMKTNDWGNPGVVRH
ncbi:hypothetical protein SK128_015099 [Halocaridina rubra]|uniref:Uncharacterized protein n=1 Tax=Halocaridina rubra TaxID=373956 RepID=A0AAN8WJ33_HALRR